MAGIFKVHRTWEDWVCIALGVVILLSPWQADHHLVMWNAVIVGALVIAISALELSGLQRWEEGVGIICGLWLIMSPFVFGYADAGMLRYWHFALGAAVALLQAIELWQDWKLSDRELAQHGN